MKKSTIENEWEKEIYRQIEEEDKVLKYAQYGVIWFLTFCLGLAIGFQVSI